MDREPARIISIVTAFVTAAAGLAAAFGLDISDEQRNAVIAAIAPTVALIVLMGELIRSRVVSPASAGEAVAIAKVEPTATNVIPDIQVSGYRSAVLENLPIPMDDKPITWRPRVSNA